MAELVQWLLTDGGYLALYGLSFWIGWKVGS